MNEPTALPPDLPAAATLTALFTQLLAKAQADPKLATLLRQLASATLEALPEPVTAALPEVEEAEAFADSPIELASEDEVAQLLTLFPYRTGPAEVLEDEGTDITLEAVPERLRLKAAACRWLFEHGFTSDEGALSERYALIDRGRAEECFLWMLDPDVVNPYATGALGVLADAYEATAAILEAWLELVGHAQEREVAQLLDEAQGGLRGAVRAVRTDSEGSIWFDEDQRAVFEDLKRYGAEHRVFLPHLSLRSIPDPAASAERLSRLAELLGQVRSQAVRVKAKQQALARLGYHAKRLTNRPHQPEHEWARLADAVRQLLTLGVPESDPELRERLAPVAALLPTDAPHSQVKRILMGLGAVEQARGERARRQDEQNRLTGVEPDAVVTKVAARLAGRTVVLIGGEPRAEVVQQLEAAFACPVLWPDAPKHASPSLFKPLIGREEVAVVLLLIRWSSHVFSEVEAFCEAHDKPLVRVPGGYNAKSLARAILEQAGDRL